MLARTIAVLGLLYLTAAAAIAANTLTAAACPVTAAPDPPFIPPAVFAGVPQPADFWYGTPTFWTRLPNSGDLLLPGRVQKVFYWRPGFDGRVEQTPALVVRLDRLDAPAAPVEIANATNASFDGTWAMLVAVVAPDAGCWQVTARYHQDVLTFVTRAGH